MCLLLVIVLCRPAARPLFGQSLPETGGGIPSSVEERLDFLEQQYSLVVEDNHRLSSQVSELTGPEAESQATIGPQW